MPISWYTMDLGRVFEMIRIVAPPSFSKPISSTVCLPQLLHLRLTISGTLPQNGTVCTTDHSGSNNIFLTTAALSHPSLGNTGSGATGAAQGGTPSSVKVGLGVGLGLGLPLTLAALIFLKVRNDRRKKYQVLKDQNSMLPEFKSDTAYIPEYIPLEEATKAKLLPKDEDS